MTAPSVTQSYATVSESRTYLSSKTDWSSADTKTKEEALLWGRYYIDANFNCGTIDMDNLSDEIKFANSVLAYDYFSQGDLFFENDKKVILSRVKAESVETEKEFSTVTRTRPNSLSKVKAILMNVCTYNKSRLVRV